MQTHEKEWYLFDLITFMQNETNQIKLIILFYI